MAIPVSEPDSDIQFLARILRATRRGDQVTSRDAHRLDQIAEHGYTRDQAPTAAEDSRIDPDDLARATAGRAQL